jgi:hypothetical protein
MCVHLVASSCIRPVTDLAWKPDATDEHGSLNMLCCIRPIADRAWKHPAKAVIDVYQSVVDAQI